MSNHKKIFIVLFFATFIIVPLTALGACRKLEVQIPGLVTNCLPALPKYIVAIYNFALMAIGVMALGALVYGGFRYLTSAGNPTALSDAKDQIFSALLGLIILFSAWLILTTINPELVLLGEPPKYNKKCTTDPECTQQDCVSGHCSVTYVQCDNPGDPPCAAQPQLYCEKNEGFCVDKPALITLYEDVDYSGNSLNIIERDGATMRPTDLASVDWDTAASSAENKISSIRINDPQYAVILFEHKDLNNNSHDRGKIMLVEYSTPNLIPYHFNDITTSYMLVKRNNTSGKATLSDGNYADPDGDGISECTHIGGTSTCEEPFTFFSSNSDFRSLTCKDGNFNDQAHCLQVGFGVLAILYEHINYEGIAEFFFQDIPDLGAYNLRGQVSSIKVINGVGCPSKPECPPQ